MAHGAVGGNKRLAAQDAAWICFEDEAGRALRPPKGRTWARRGHTPVIKVCAKGSGRVSIAALLAVRPGARARLLFTLREHRGRKGERKSLSERDYARLLDSAHRQLRAPILLIWDNLNTHVDTVMRELIAARPWLTVHRLPSYAPDLNPVEALWAHLRTSMGNLLTTSVDQLSAAARSRLKSLQYRPTVLKGFMAEAGLTLEPP